MILCDVNVLLYAFRVDSERHQEYHAWLVEQLTGAANVGVSELVLSSFIRICTHPRVYRIPSKPEESFAFADAIRTSPNAVMVTPGARHWDIFRDLSQQCGARGNLVPDAYLAALAIEWGCEWITTDRDYARFQGLTWRHPLQ
ncbi:MAG: type II toxin-antitoxin system VapC family toxin [Gemmatimonadales bacterium]